MPLTEKGEEIKSALEKEYGAERGERVLYAGKNKGTFTGIDAIADAVNNLQQRFDAMCDADEKYWTYKPASRTPSVSDLPKGAFKGTQEEFSRLSPGMRREIERSAAKQRA